MVSDLPVELWLEVLRSLPQGTLPKMIGISRYLFEAGMNEMYEEINLAAGVKVRRCVEQLQSPTITPRVRRLRVDVAFIPFQLPKHHFNRKIVTRVRKWFSMNAVPVLSNSLIGVLDGLRRCINLREVTIEAPPGDIMTPVCSEFLDELVQALGSRVHILNMKIEISNSQRFIPFASALTNLTTLKLELRSRFFHPVQQESSLEFGLLCIQDLGNLVASVRDTLTTFTVTTHCTGFKAGNIEELFPIHVGLFPNLRHFKFEFSIYGMRLGHPERLAKFIGHCSPNLECIELVPDGYVYSHMSDVSQNYALLLSELKTRKASSLRVLVVFLSHQEITPFFTMLAAGFAPNLQKLIILPQSGSRAFGYEEFSALVGSVVKGGSGKTLEELHTCVRVFSPAHLDLLHTQFPRLQSLHLDYSYLNMSPNDSAQRESSDVVLAAFRKQVHPDWSKKKLDFQELKGPTSNEHLDRQLRDLIADGLES